MSSPPIIITEKKAPKKPFFYKIAYLLILLMVLIVAILSIREETELEELESNLEHLDFKDSVRYCQLKAQQQGQAPSFCVEIIKKYRKQSFDCLPLLATSVFQKQMQKEVLIGKKKYKHITFGKNMKALDEQNISKNIDLIELSQEWKIILELIENARYVESQNDKTGNQQVNYHVLESDFICNQKAYKVKIVLKESAMGLYLYDVDLI